jgi:Bor protein
MRRLLALASPILAGLAAAACFHATVVTGASPGTQVINKPWASSFIFGLVPPKTVEAASECPNGVATVETQHSFLNSLVAFLTLDIYTPMTITVTCASGGRSDTGQIRPDISVSEAQGEASVRDAFNAAAAQAAASRSPVLVQVRQ